MGDWKGDKAEGEMKAYGKKMMKEAQERAEEKENQEWEEFKTSLLENSDNDFYTFEDVSKVVDSMRTQGYSIPTKEN